MATDVLAARQPLCLHSVSDSLLKGLTHALSNRAATLGAVVHLLEPGEHGATREAQAGRSLARELERLEEVLRLLRLLPRERRGVPEPVRLRDLLADVTALQEHHCELRNVRCEVLGAVDVPPIWIERWALTHMLLLLVTAAKRDALAVGTDGVALRCYGDHATVVVVVEPYVGGARPGPAVGAQEIERGLANADDIRDVLEEAGAEMLVAGDERTGPRYELRFPSLLEIRRREREGYRRSQSGG